MLRHARSLQSELEENDVQSGAAEPGPGHYYTGYSSLGKQQLGKCPTAPEIGFAHTGWENWQKVMVTKSHLKSVKCREGPGHPYNPDVSSIRLSTNGCTKGTFGASGRPDLNGQMGAGTKGSPGPNINLREMTRFELGVDPYIRSRTMRTGGSFSTSRRFTKDNKVDGGPGTHERKDFALRAGTGRTFGIGRNYYDKVVRPGWEKDGQGKSSKDVGPPLWSDIEKNGSRGSSIGRAERFPAFKIDDGPGPGEYPRNERDVAVNALKKGGCVVSDTRSPSCPNFGKVPKKPRWRTTLATTTAARGGWGYF